MVYTGLWNILSLLGFGRGVRFTDFFVQVFALSCVLILASSGCTTRNPRSFVAIAVSSERSHVIVVEVMCTTACVEQSVWMVRAVGLPPLLAPTRPCWPERTQRWCVTSPRPRLLIAMASPGFLAVSPSGRLRFVPRPVPALPANLQARRYNRAPRVRDADGHATRLLGAAPGQRFLPVELGHSTTRSSHREIVGLRRRTLAGPQALSERYLADRRITAKTVATYTAAHLEFQKWARAQCLSTSGEALDRSLRQYLQHLFFKGAPPFDARQAVHGTIFALELPKAAQTLPLAKATLGGFSKSSPEHARDPMPEEALFLLAENLLERGGDGIHAAGALCTSFDGFFRPSEVLSVSAQDVHVLTGRKRKLDLPPATIRLRPLGQHLPGMEVPQRTKAGDHDDSIAFGVSRGAPGGRSWVATFLAKLAKKRRGLLFPISLQRYEALFKQASLEAGLDKLRLTPHCARHGAASTSYATGRMTLKDIQKRGRWRSASSVRVYEKSARLARQLSRMSMDQRTRANQLSTTLPSLLLAVI